MKKSEKAKKVKRPKWAIVIFKKGVSSGSKLLVNMLFLWALGFLAIGIAMLIITPEDLGWLSAGAMAAIFMTFAWLIARKKI